MPAKRTMGNVTLRNSNRTFWKIPPGSWLIDGKIHQNEMDYCLEMAINLGFRPTVVNELINYIIEQANKGVQKERVKSEASAFLNGF